MAIVEMRVPTIGESITEVTLSQWLVANGDYVKLDQPICEFESDKATLEFPAEAEGKLIHIAAEDDDIEIGALVAKIDTSVAAPSGGSEKAPEAAAPVKAEAPAPEPASQNYATGHPSPAAAKIIREKGIDASKIAGSGKDGRITKADAQAANVPAASQPAAPASVPSVGTFSRGTKSEKMSRMRRTIAKRLVSAKNNTAMLTTFNEVDLSQVMAMRKKYQEKFVEKHGVKLGFMSLFSKAVANVLMEMPDVNAQINEDGTHIQYHDYADISIAISTPTGLDQWWSIWIASKYTDNK